MRGLSAPVRAVLLMLLANACVAGTTCTIRMAAAALLARLLFAQVPSIYGRAAVTDPETLAAPPARAG